MAQALNGWHAGERAVQNQLGYSTAVGDLWRKVKDEMPLQHRLFWMSNISFLALTSFDDKGRPWSSIVAGEDGETGFISSPDSRTLILNVRLWPGDMLLDTMNVWLDTEQRSSAARSRFLTAGVGIEFSTRRRNKFAGHIQGVTKLTELDFQISIHVKEALGNCPKYINLRHFEPHISTAPSIVTRDMSIGPRDHLPQNARGMIENADTVFIGSIYEANKSTAGLFPSHAGMNSRSGLPGFIRVDPTNRRTLILPDYSGNRLVTSLGNIESSHLASLTFVDFRSGSILYLSCTAHNLFGHDARKAMPRQNCVLVLEPTGMVLVKDAMPVRQSYDTQVRPSPYSPRTRYLAVEQNEPSAVASTNKAQLVSAERISDDLAVFGFTISINDPSRSGSGKPAGLSLNPGQAIILDFMHWIGPPTYSHMADEKPGSINDDRVRSWTVSSLCPQNSKVRESTQGYGQVDFNAFELTMREVKGGIVTGRLFDLLRGIENGDRIDLSNSNVVADVVGIAGEFCLPRSNTRKQLWVAGGIGITPFLAMLEGLRHQRTAVDWDITLVLAARDATFMIHLLWRVAARLPHTAHLCVNLFTKEKDIKTVQYTRSSVILALHEGRINKNYWQQFDASTEVMICGPLAFGDDVMEGLRAAGFNGHQIRREGFY